MESMHAGTLAVLNSLIDSCKDSQHSYKICAEIIDREELKDLFEKIAYQREGFINELQQETTKYEADEEPKVNLSGSIEGWKNLKAMIERPDSKAILELCDNEEEKMKYLYNEAVKKDVPGETKTLITHQYNKVRDTHNEIKQMREKVSES